MLTRLPDRENGHPRAQDARAARPRATRAPAPPSPDEDRRRRVAAGEDARSPEDPVPTQRRAA